MNEVLQSLDTDSAYSLISEKLEAWWASMIKLLPNFLLAVIVLILFWLVARFVKSTSSKLMRRFSDNSSLNYLLSATAYIVIMVIGAFMALSILQLDKTVTSLLAGAGILGLALGFAFQDIASNFVAGILMAVRKPFRVGDVLETNDYTGIVTEMNLRATIVKDFQGQEVILPNKEVFQNGIKNYSRYKKRRIDLSVGISYGEDLQQVKDVVLGAIERLDVLDKEKSVEFVYTGFGDSSINFDVLYWVPNPTQLEYRKAISAGIMAIKKAFDENDINIPFPIRTLDFGIKGGEKLHESLDLSKELKSLNIKK